MWSRTEVVPERKDFPAWILILNLAAAVFSWLWWAGKCQKYHRSSFFSSPLAFCYRHSESEFFFSFLALVVGQEGNLPCHLMVPFPCGQECQDCSKAPGGAVAAVPVHAWHCPCRWKHCCGSNPSWCARILIQSEAPCRAQSTEYWFLFWISLQTAISPSYLHQTSWKMLYYPSGDAEFPEFGIWGLGKREQHRAPPAGPAAKHSHRIQGMK